MTHSEWLFLAGALSLAAIYLTWNVVIAPLIERAPRVHPDGGRYVEPRRWRFEPGRWLRRTGRFGLLLVLGGYFTAWEYGYQTHLTFFVPGADQQTDFIDRWAGGFIALLAGIIPLIVLSGIAGVIYWVWHGDDDGDDT